MDDRVTCPSCGTEFAPGEALRLRMEADVRAHVHEELKVKFAEVRALADAAGARETELLAKEQALAAKARDGALDLERKLAAERVKIQAEAERYAAEQAKLAVEKEREAMRRDEALVAAELAKTQSELEAAKRRAAAVAETEATLLRRQRALEDREQQAGLEVERKLAEERGKIVATAEETARARFEALAKAEAERIARDAQSELERLRADTEREKTAFTKELEDARKKAREAASREADLLRKERELADRERDAALSVERQLAAERLRIQADAERQAAEAADLRVQAKAEELRREAATRLETIEQDLAQARKRADDAAKKEVELLRAQQALEAARQQMELDAERRLVEERQRIQQQVDGMAEERLRLAAEQSRLREKEHEDRTAQLQRTVDALQQKLAQGSQQTQGEAQELVLRDVLAETFPEDRIEDVPKGVRGADLLQRVCDAAGDECGTIVWESKRTQSWSDTWLPKLRDDLRETGGAVAVIVSQALPPGIKTFDVRDGVWICGSAHARALASALRLGILDVHRARRASEGKESKMIQLYDYLTGHDFRNRVQGVIEAMAALQEELASERRVYQRVWKRREVLITRALDQMGSVYGSLQGIAGAKLGDIDVLSISGSTPRLLDAASDDELEEDDGEATCGAVSPEIERALYDLVPPDGRAIGNGALRAELQLRHQVSEAEFQAARDRLLARGLLRKGRGRGGAVMRTGRSLDGIAPAAEGTA